MLAHGPVGSFCSSIVTGAINESDAFDRPSKGTLTFDEKSPWQVGPILVTKVSAG